MAGTLPEKRTASCPCGAVTLELVGKPIVAATCYCHSCQQAGQAFDALPGAPGVLDADGGTPYLLVRKDRIAWISGTDQLDAHRLKADSPTRRFVARCCNTPIALEFTKGHWLSVYAGRIPAGERPPPAMRTMVQDRPDGIEFADDVPSYATHSGKFMWKLLSAWAAMGFRAPPIEKTQGWAR
ncbi:MAG: GFA family protein [Sphingopyxis sp.]